DTKPIREGWVVKEDMLDISGRSRSRQIELASEFGIVDYPHPAGGCLLTDRNYTLRLQDLINHNQMDSTNLELLKYGRHFRLDKQLKLIVGRDEAENIELEKIAGSMPQLKACDYTGPIGILTADPGDGLSLAAQIFLHYVNKARDEADIELSRSGREVSIIRARKPVLEILKLYRLSYD
ncbi:MAG TPA: tRNA (5-methylaminomethyl-2-thiouridylate)-methyltransferase, partial [Candidatus Cloacimonadota bacterium]|nr:tRNA (5-methylaminomethyl-2-thiouridylate)-methyltransferase [Candidatus Cloacimonadota bacterium]